MAEPDEKSGAGPLRPPLRLTRRAEFLAAAKGRRFHSRSFSLQAGRRNEAKVMPPPRFGFTVTKKIGNAVIRNRIRRRLKEALRLARDLPARPGYDYVIVARPAALDQSFCVLQDELRRAMVGIHQPHPGAAAAKAEGRGTRGAQDRRLGGHEA